MSLILLTIYLFLVVAVVIAGVLVLKFYRQGQIKAYSIIAAPLISCGIYVLLLLYWYIKGKVWSLEPELIIPSALILLPFILAYYLEESSWKKEELKMALLISILFSTIVGVIFYDKLISVDKIISLQVSH